MDKQLRQMLSGPVISLLDSCPGSMWTRLHAACRDAVASAEKALFKVCTGAPDRGRPTRWVGAGWSHAVQLYKAAAAHFACSTCV